MPQQHRHSKLPLKSKKHHQRHRRRICRRVITRPESGIIDLTGDVVIDLEEADHHNVGYEVLEDNHLLWEDEEDYWWPDSGHIDPNFDGDDFN